MVRRRYGQSAYISAKEKRKLTYYTLVIETAGTAQTLLADTDEAPVRELASVITAALGSPEAHVQLDAKSQLASAIRQYGKPGNRRKLMRAELDGTLRVLITRGAGTAGKARNTRRLRNGSGSMGRRKITRSATPTWWRPTARLSSA